MRVLMFGWEYPPHVAGGLATATVGLVKGLLACGTEVTLVVPFPGADADDGGGLRIVSAPRLLSVHRVASPLEPYGDAAAYDEVLDGLERARPGATALYGRNLLAEVERLARIAAEIARQEPHDVIDAHDWMTFPAGLAARAASGKPLVLHIHATEIDRQGEGADPDVVERERSALLEADRVIANSHAIKEICVQRYGVPGDRVDVIHWGVDRDGRAEPGSARSPLRTPAGGRPPTVLFLGRVTRQKGPDRFLEVAARVSAVEPGARFVLAGAGDLLHGLMERAAELAIAGRVFFTGKVTAPEATRLYGIADVCVMPSVSEPFGLVALESALNGTPVIVPRSSGVAEVLRNAFKADFWDVDAMADAVVSLLRHPCLRDELAGNARAELEAPRFGLEEPGVRTRAVYERVAP